MTAKKENKLSIGSYSLKDLAPQFRKKLQDAIDNSLAKVKGLPPKTMLLLRQRFRNWALITNKEINASLTDRTKESEKHLRSVITDQYRKMIGATDRITAKENGAIGFVWWTRKDNEVVGNPSGKYPEVIDPKVHGNHYEREGKFYLYRDTWAIKEGYIMPRNDVIYADTLPDGLPSEGAGCRCIGSNVYSLDRIPEKFKGCITEKGRTYIKEFET